MNRGRCCTAVVGVLGFVLSMRPLPAVSQIIDQNQPSGPANAAGFFQQDLAQSFQPALSDMVGAGILLRPDGSYTGTVTIQLWTLLPNQSGAVMLAQASGVGTSGNWVDVFWNPVQVTPGQTYFLVFTGDNINLVIAGDGNNPYPLGQMYANADFQSYPLSDYAFRTWVRPKAPAPVASATVLVGLFVLLTAAGFLALHRRTVR